MKIALSEITEVIRSKNAGPYELTFDIMFKDYAWFERVCAAKVFNKPMAAALFRIPLEDVLGVVEFRPAKAIKITIRRPIPSGNIGKTDVYGAQQHGPLIDLVIEI